VCVCGGGGGGLSGLSVKSEWRCEMSVKWKHEREECGKKKKRAREHVREIESGAVHHKGRSWVVRMRAGER
jgi:hypothetical protein